MINEWDYSLGIIAGFVLAGQPPLEIRNAVNRLKEGIVAKPYTPEKVIEPLPDARKINSKANALLEKEAERVETERAKKPRKPFSSDELERRRKQLATARSKRKKKTETTPRDPNTKDLFEKNV